VEKKILRLLVVDDSPDDAEATVAAVRKGGYMIKSQRVQDLAAMQAALDKGQWDVVLAEYAVPHFGAQMAYDLVKRTGLEIPFIVLARTIKDADILKIMQAGAHDVILKNDPIRLAPVIGRELRVAEDRRALRAAMQKLQETENKSRAIIDGSREAICYSQDGMHINANKTYLTLFGYLEATELEGIPVMNLIDKSEHPRFKELLRQVAKSGAVEPQEFLAIRQDGTRLPVELAVSPLTLEGESCIQILVTDITRRKAVENKLQYLNQHDPLTGLYNRHYFLQELGKAVAQAKQGKTTAAILFIDLDHLKSINDALGYATGDRLLIRIAKLFRERLGEDAILSRFGGDEFAALLHNKTAAQVAQNAEAIKAVLHEASITEGGKTYQCHCTLNTTFIDKNTESAQQALTHAYQGSQKARPVPREPAAEVIVPAPTAPPVTPRHAEPPTPLGAAARMPGSGGGQWAEQLKQALAKDDFTLAYQPVISLHGEAAEYFEVLLRLNGPHGEPIPPGQFMPAAEEAGLTSAIDRWVARQSIEALLALHSEGREASFFINLSPASLTDKELLPQVAQALFTAALKPERIIFEVDEAVLTAHPATATTFIKAVQKIGCRFAIDNFGKGLDVLQHLRGQPIHFVKIDGALIRNLAGDNVSQASLKALIEVARALHLQTIAKSVEKAENLAMLWNFGVDYVMGNYFQEADAQLNYEFAGETTLSSDSTTAPNWASGGHNR
jgi:diguanylate cyclase (GGDEF)-like protein/PAS domain S-box-containing protein